MSSTIIEILVEAVAFAVASFFWREPRHLTQNFSFFQEIPRCVYNLRLILQFLQYYIQVLNYPNNLALFLTIILFHYSILRFPN